MEPTSQTCLAQRQRKQFTWTMWHLLGVCVILITLPVGSSALGQMPDDIQQFLTVLENGDSAKSAVKEPVSVMWGIADVSATAGKLFQYMLPKEAFKGEVSSYKVTEVGKSELPEWMLYDAAKFMLRGVPDIDDADKYTLEVTAIGKYANDTASYAKDVFTVNVQDDTQIPSIATPLKEASSDDMKPIRCQEGSSVTSVTVILDTDLDSLLPTEKISVIENMKDHLSIPAELLKLAPVGNKPMFDSSALVAGPGDVKKPQFAGTTLQWEVGCGNVNGNHMPVLQRVEATSHDGSMSKAVGHGVIGWHVTNNHPHVVQRMKRQAPNIQATPTLQPTLGPPTQQPVPTMVIGETGEHPVTRAVPSMASPTFSGAIKPTKTKHKHHHRTKTRGRHHHKSKHHKPKHSPTRKHHYKTNTRTPMPTPTVLPIQPTRVVDMTPTIIGTDLQHPMPTFSVASPGVSRTGSFLEPSMTPPLPPTKSEMTESLPTRTYVVPTDTMTTDPVKPSKTDDNIVGPTKHTEKPPTEKPDKMPMPTPDPDEETFNYAPILRNDIDRIVVTVGDVLNYKIPFDTFYDFEDGDTANLKLVFLTVDGLTLPRRSWVHLDPDEQVLYGLPLETDVGRQEYIMAAIDRKGKIARDAFEIVVQRQPYDVKINHEFSLTLDMEYKQFLMDVKARLDVANKIASVYGDTDESKMTVTKIEKGSVVYAWTNNTIPTDTCPARQLGLLRQYILTANNTLNQTMIEKMKPYKVLRAGAEAKGVCVTSGGMKSVDSVNKPPTPADGDPGQVGPAPRETSEEDVLITTVIPAVVIVAMLLLAACIACILYRKNRKGKLSDEDQHTFVNKGIPIIFADELEEKPDPPTKPLIMTDEKPPLPPPEYPRGSSVPTTPHFDHKEPLDMEEELHNTDMTSPLYQPPPPFMEVRDNRQHPHRPKMQPTYRNPPPYVPP